MKITRVTLNNRKRSFEVSTRSRSFSYPFAVAEPSPLPSDRVVAVQVDRELGNEAFTYRLESGREGTVHIDHVLEYHRDPATMADLLLHALTVEARKRVEASPLGVREIVRRLGTSATQFYRLLDTTNNRKSIKQMVELLTILGCEIDLVVRERRSA